MNVSGGLTKFVMWGIFILAALAVIGLWYIGAAIVGGLIFLALRYGKSAKRKRAIANLEPISGPRLTQKQEEMRLSGGHLSLESSSSLRVVETLAYADSQKSISLGQQLEPGEVVTIQGWLVCATRKSQELTSVPPVDDQVIVVSVGNLILGELPNVDMATWFQSILDVGGAADCRVEFHTGRDGAAKKLRVLASEVLS